MRPERLAIVTGGMDLGGTTTFMCNLAGELIRRNIPAAVFSLSHDHPLASDFSRQRIPVYCTDERTQIFEDRLTAVLVRLAEFAPTSVIANLSASSYEALRYVPAGIHRIAAIQSDNTGWYQLLRQYHESVDLVAAVSETITMKVRALPEYGRKRVCYLPYGVPMPETPSGRFGDPQKPLRILYVGRLIQEQKRVQLFPGILEQLKQSGIPFHWTIAGEGPERAALEAAMKSAGPSQTVSFIGKVAYEDIPQLISAHDIFLLASDHEGLPLSLLEAMGSGMVPVVSALPSGISELLNENTGIAVPPDQHAGYAAAIIQLHHQRDRLQAISRQAREKVLGEFSIPAMTDRWLAALPQGQPAHIIWPTQFAIKPILAAKDPWRFSPPVRWLRRTLIKFRKPA
jgi:glycosyltransferase involved in cell wall biosynthesis